MMRHPIPVVVAVLAVSILALSLSLATAPATATSGSQSPTCDELIDTLHGYENDSAFTDYSEFSVLRTQAITDAQVGTCTTSKRTRLGTVADVLESFVAAHEAANHGEFDSAFEYAEQTQENVSALREQGGTEYAALSSIALERFYRSLGDSLANDARSATRTPDEITQLELAITAYEQAGVTDRYSKLTVRVQNLSAHYERDMRVVNETAADTESFLASCPGCDSSMAAATNSLSSISQYQRVRTLQRKLANAETQLESHGLDASTQDVGSLSERTRAASRSLAAGGAIILGGFSIVLAILASLIAWRIGLWKRDLSASRVDDIVLTEVAR